MLCFLFLCWYVKNKRETNWTCIQIYDFNVANLTVLVTDCRTLLVGTALSSSILESGYSYFDLVCLKHDIVWSFVEMGGWESRSDSRDMVLSSLILAERFLSSAIRSYWNLLEKR